MRVIILLCVFLAVASAQLPKATAPGGTGASAVSDLTDFKLTRTAATTLSVGAGTVIVNGKWFTVGACTATLTPTSPSAETFFAYFQNGTPVIARSGSDPAIACTGYTVNTGVSAMPNTADVIPMWQYAAITTPGQWNVSGGTDWRALLNRFAGVAGIGTTLTCIATTGVCTIAIDTATTPQFTSGTAAAPGSCTIGQEYIKTDTNTVYKCTSTNTFSLMN